MKRLFSVLLCLGLGVGCAVDLEAVEGEASELNRRPPQGGRVDINPAVQWATAIALAQPKDWHTVLGQQRRLLTEYGDGSCPGACRDGECIFSGPCETPDGYRGDGYFEIALGEEQASSFADQFHFENPSAPGDLNLLSSHGVITSSETLGPCGDRDADVCSEFDWEVSGLDEDEPARWEIQGSPGPLSPINGIGITSMNARGAFAGVVTCDQDSAVLEDLRRRSAGTAQLQGADVVWRAEWDLNWHYVKTDEGEDGAREEPLGAIRLALETPSGDVLARVSVRYYQSSLGCGFMFLNGIPAGVACGGTAIGGPSCDGR